MRMIEAFAKMIAAIIGLREKGELDKARALVEAQSGDFSLTRFDKITELEQKLSGSN